MSEAGRPPGPRAFGGRRASSGGGCPPPDRVRARGCCCNCVPFAVSRTGQRGEPVLYRDNGRPPRAHHARDGVEERRSSREGDRTAQRTPARGRDFWRHGGEGLPPLARKPDLSRAWLWADRDSNRGGRYDSSGTRVGSRADNPTRVDLSARQQVDVGPMEGRGIDHTVAFWRARASAAVSDGAATDPNLAATTQSASRISSAPWIPAPCLARCSLASAFRRGYNFGHGRSGEATRHL
jgi:hypothetical protein